MNGSDARNIYLIIVKAFITFLLYVFINGNIHIYYMRSIKIYEAE